MAYITLWSTASLDSKIAINSYKISQARAAAQSGINHFMSLNLGIEDNHDGIVIPETQLTSRLSYTVEAYVTYEGRVVILSRGLYRKGSKVLYQHPIRAVVVKQ